MLFHRLTALSAFTALGRSLDAGSTVYDSNHKLFTLCFFFLATA